MKNERSLYWALLLYEESENLSFNNIDLSNYDYLYIKHDKDKLEDGTLKKSEGLCFVTHNLSKTIIKSVDEKDFYMNEGVMLSSLPSILQYGDKVSFKPKSGEEDDLELIREKGCYVFYHNE